MLWCIDDAANRRFSWGISLAIYNISSMDTKTETWWNSFILAQRLATHWTMTSGIDRYVRLLIHTWGFVTLLRMVYFSRLIYNCCLTIFTRLPSSGYPLGAPPTARCKSINRTCVSPLWPLVSAFTVTLKILLMSLSCQVLWFSFPANLGLFLNWPNLIHLSRWSTYFKHH